MKIKSQYNLQPHEIPAHSVVIEDDAGNPIIVVVQLNEAVVFSAAGDKDFHEMLKNLGITKTVKVTHLKPKPVEDLIWTP